MFLKKKVGCADKIMQQLSIYLSKQDVSNEIKTLSQLSENIALKDIVSNYYCAKIYNETTNLYEGYDGISRFQDEDLFIEQSE